MRQEMSDRYLDQVKAEIGALRRALESLPDSEMEKIVRMARSMAGALSSGKIVFTCGNGGSAADAQHIAGELVQGGSSHR